MFILILFQSFILKTLSRFHVNNFRWCRFVTVSLTKSKAYKHAGSAETNRNSRVVELKFVEETEIIQCKIYTCGNMKILVLLNNFSSLYKFVRLARLFVYIPC